MASSASYLVVAGQLLAGLILLLAAGKKALQGTEKLVVTVRDYRLIPQSLIFPVARMLPGLEATVGILLIGNLGQPVVGVAAATLYMVFAAAVGANILRGRRHIDCGCFGGSASKPLTWTLVSRNTVLAVASASSAGILSIPFLDRPTKVSPWDNLFLLSIVLSIVMAVGLMRLAGKAQILIPGQGRDAGPFGFVARGG